MDGGVNAVMTMQMPVVNERYVHVNAHTDYEEWMTMFQRCSATLVFFATP